MSLLPRCSSSLRCYPWLPNKSATTVVSRMDAVTTRCVCAAVSVSPFFSVADPILSLQILPAIGAGRWITGIPSAEYQWNNHNYLISTLRNPQYPTQIRWKSSSHRGKIPRMSECRSLGEALDAACENLDDLSPRNLAAFWTVVPKFLQRQSRESGRQRKKHVHDHTQMALQYNTVLAYTLEEIESWSHRDIAQTTLGLAKIVKFVGNKGRRPPNGSPHQILHGVIVGNDAVNKDFIFHHIALASMPILHAFDARSLSNFIYAYTIAECSPKFEDGSALYDIVAQVAVANLRRFNAQDLSNMLWAYATAKAANSALFVEVADTIVALRSLNEFKPQELSNIVWAYATADEIHPMLFKEIAEHVIAHDNLNEFNEQAISNIILAYATVEQSRTMLYKKVADHIISLENLESFKHQGLSNLVWAFATTKEAHPKLFKKVADNIISSHDLRPFKPQELSNLVWAFATADESNQKLFTKVANHILAVNNLNEFTAQNLSNTLWAYASAQESSPVLFQNVAEAAMKVRTNFNSQEVANLLWANASNAQTYQNMFLSFELTAETLVRKCSSQELANISWAYAVANTSAPSLFNDNFIQTCLNRESNFNVEELSQLHQWQLWQEELKSNIQLPQSLQEKCYESFVSKVPNPSALQDDVISELSYIGMQPKEEVLTKQGYRLDAVVEINGKKIGIEVDGPSHFLDRNPTGSTILKRRQVKNLEQIPIVSIPFWEWDELRQNSGQKQIYLKSLLSQYN